MATRTQLGEFLRTCRARVSPDAAGLGVDSVRPGRRVRGLRREEVAHLAGVSVDYYSRLEQGRHSTPSDAVINALARALQLDGAAHAHLLDLARPVRRPVSPPRVQRVRPALHQLLESFVDHPAFIIGRRTDVLASNDLARALITDWERMPARYRNYTRWLLLDPTAREVYEDWSTVAAEAVGTLRLAAGREADDRLLTELVGELAISSPEFRAWWGNHRVDERTHGTKRMRHPVVGPVTIHYGALALPGDPDQTLFVYSTEPGSASRDNMRLLASWFAGRGEHRTPGASTTPTNQESSEGAPADDAHPAPS